MDSCLKTALRALNVIEGFSFDLGLSLLILTTLSGVISETLPSTNATFALHLGLLNSIIS